MKNRNQTYLSNAVLFAFAILLTLGCSRDIEDLDLASFPNTPEVFIDGFSPGLNYAAFGGSKVTAFDVDRNVSFDGSASMVFAVPDAGDPEGGYAGGAFFTDAGRDLSGYDALTFWARASKSATIDLVGFGNDLAESAHVVSMRDVAVNTNWQKFAIPIPDASKLVEERGMFFYSEGPEDGKGYTFWIDELKFEKLGTLEHQRSGILQGEDQVVSAETGDVLSVTGFTATFNLPNGVDQSVDCAPSYFDFSSSATDVATVSNKGEVMVIDSGQVVITAALNGLTANGSLTVNSTGDPIMPMSPAPTPTVNPDSVISLFSNAYTDVNVDTWNTGWQFSTAQLIDIQIAGNDVKRYKQLNFVGIEFSSETIDATEMTHFHIDIWTPDPTDLPAAFRTLLVDFGANGTFDGGDDSSHELSFTSPTLVTQEWISIDVPLSSFTNLTNRGHMAQMVLSGDIPNVYVDNVYFYISGQSGPTEPTEAAPTPTRDPADVISIFSDAFPNIADTDFNPDWGQATVATQELIDNNNTLVYKGLNYQGIQLATGQDVSGMEFLHIDYWTANSTALNAFLISTGPTETPKALTVPTSGWSSIDIPLAEFDPVDLMDIIQFKFDGNGDIFLDNIYFYKEPSGGGGPAQAAPTPTNDPADVISIFSDAFTNVANTDFNPNWGQGTVVTQELIDNNNTLVFTGLDFQGMQLGSSQDVSGMEFLHIDYWSSNSSALNAFLISTGPVETPSVLTVPTAGWNSVDIPLADFNPVDLMDIIQFKFDGNGDIYLDNIYFYKEPSGGGGPTEAAPTPMRDAADVISVFSDAYPNIADTDFNPNWGQATVVTQEMIDNNNTLVYTGLNFQGMQLGSSQDVSGMEFLHIDFWSSNSTALNAFLISSGPVETPSALTVPTSGWSSVDIPLADFSPVDLMDIVQFKFDGNGDIYLDNIYFYKEPSGGGPTEAAPIPTADPANVISVFSDTYTNVADTDFNPNWGQATVVTQEMIDNNNMLVYSGLNYQGIQLGSSQDVSGMEFLHIDYWTSNSSALNAFLISSGPVEMPSALSVPTSGWNSIDIPLTDFNPVDLMDIIQFKFDGNGDIYLDNIYFYKQ